MPKSLRLTVKMASTPPRSPIPISAMPVTSIMAVIGLVTPCMVRSPATSTKPSKPFLAEVDLKVSFGNSMELKKSALFRWPSSFGSLVSMLSTEMSTANAIFVTSSAMVKVPDTSLMRPQN